MYSHLPVSPLRLQMFGYGSAPLNEGLGDMVFCYRNPEGKDRRSESKQIGGKVHFLMEAKAAFPIRSCSRCCSPPKLVPMHPTACR